MNNLAKIIGDISIAKLKFLQNSKYSLATNNYSKQLGIPSWKYNTSKHHLKTTAFSSCWKKTYMYACWNKFLYSVELLIESIFGTGIFFYIIYYSIIIWQQIYLLVRIWKGYKSTYIYCIWMSTGLQSLELSD